MFSLIGAGAVGTTLTTVLQEAGYPVRLYTRDKDRAAFAAAGGVQLQRPGQAPLRLPLPELSDQPWRPDSRYLILATKFSALPAVADALGPVPAQVCLVSTLNGVQALPWLRARLPGVSAVPLSIMFNSQHLGVLSAALTTRAKVVVGHDDRELAALLKRTRLSVSVARGETVCWGKLLINLGNALGALTDSTFRDLLSEPTLRSIFADVLEEAGACLESGGIDYRLPLPLSLGGYCALLRHGGGITWPLARIANGLDNGAYPSMVADLRAGRLTEVRQLNGEIAALGARIGLATPLNARLVELIEARGERPASPMTPAELHAALGRQR